MFHKCETEEINECISERISNMDIAGKKTELCKVDCATTDSIYRAEREIDAVCEDSYHLSVEIGEMQAKVRSMKELDEVSKNMNEFGSLSLSEDISVQLNFLDIVSKTILLNKDRIDTIIKYITPVEHMYGVKLFTNEEDEMLSSIIITLTSDMSDIERNRDLLKSINEKLRRGNLETDEMIHLWRNVKKTCESLIDVYGERNRKFKEVSRISMNVNRRVDELIGLLRANSAKKTAAAAGATACDNVDTFMYRKDDETTIYKDGYVEDFDDVEVVGELRYN
ncbi:MAG: hypothetical protein KDH96_10045 [Candidatus Riesia sp.]|nr:hypothetical protein [Candidatus Riesia sp.]